MQWYTIISKPRKEIQVANYLRSQDIAVYHPTIKVNPVNPRSARIRSYFPRYLFVNADLDEVGTSTLTWVPGAVGLVEFGGEPAVVPDIFIGKLQERIAEINTAGGLHLDGLEKGDTVRITSGPFAGYDAIFDAHLSGEERVQVLLHWLGREMKTKLNANAIEKRRTR